MDIDYIIIKYYLHSSVVTMGAGTQYAKIVPTKTRNSGCVTIQDPYTAKLIPLTKAEAKAIIREEGLPLVHEDEDGAIWDGCGFREKYFGQIHIPRYL